MVIDVREEHPAKAIIPIVATPSGTTTTLAHIGVQFAAVIGFSFCRAFSPLG